MNDAHSDLTAYCRGEIGEEDEYGNFDLCNTELTYEDNFVGLARKRSWEGKALKLVCDECGESTLVCPVCHGGGWYRGEQTGANLACHNCNLKEHQRQRRQEMGY